MAKEDNTVSNEAEVQEQPGTPVESISLRDLDQIAQIIDRKSSEDVSILTTQMLIFGEVCWIGYAFHIESVSVFVYGALSLILLSVQLGVILHYRQPKEA
mgnify:CR=1 FL=1